MKLLKFGLPVFLPVAITVVALLTLGAVSMAQTPVQGPRIDSRNSTSADEARQFLGFTPSQVKTTPPGWTLAGIVSNKLPMGALSIPIATAKYNSPDLKSFIQLESSTGPMHVGTIDGTVSEKVKLQGVDATIYTNATVRPGLFIVEWQKGGVTIQATAVGLDRTELLRILESVS